MQFFKIIGLLLLAAILTVVALVLLKVTPRIQPTVAPVISNFEECAAKYPVMESYPRQCRTEDGRVFVEEIPMQEATTSESNFITLQNGCAVAGCSGQLCVSEGEASTIITTCEYNAKYACYQDASCEPQSDGKCGWTQTAELKQCLAHPPAIEGGGNLEVQ